MTTSLTVKTIMLGTVLLFGSGAFAAEQPGAATQSATVTSAPQGKESVAKASAGPTVTLKVPISSTEFDKFPIAMVNGEPIRFGQLLNAIAEMHSSKREQQTSAKMDYTEMLDRLINVRLLIQEAKNIGLDQAPEIKNYVQSFGETGLREMLYREQTQGVKADEKVVERVYRERIREWKIASVLFPKEGDAKKMLAELKAGKPFQDLAAQALKAGTAQGSGVAVYQKMHEMQPQVKAALDKMKQGEVSPVVPVQGGYAVIKLDEARSVEDPALKARLGQEAEEAAKQLVLRKYRASLVKKYAQVKTKLLASLDFEAPKPGFKALLKDKRVLATVKGEPGVTVAELAKALGDKFFHGVDNAIKQKKLNAIKEAMLNDMLMKRTLLKEARSKGLDKTEEYQERMKAYTEELLFGTFMEKVVRPDVRTKEEQAREYFKEHIAEYTEPATVSMRGLAFTTVQAAQANADKLRQGVDLAFLKTSADSQVAPDDADLITLDGEPVPLTSLPQGLTKALTGVGNGEVRLYSDEHGHHYVIKVDEYQPAHEMTYEEAKTTVLPLVHQANLRKAIEEWMKKLRAASEVQVYLAAGGK